MTGARWITEADVVAVLDLPAAIDALRTGLVALSDRRAATLPKSHLSTPDHATLHALGGWLAHAPGGLGVVGIKSWAHTAGGASPLLTVWSSADGSLLGVVEAFALGQLRTAATTGVASSVLAPTDTRIGALIGTGKQSVAQAAAMVVACSLRELRVFSPDPTRRAEFPHRLSQAGVDVRVVLADSVAEAVDGAALITLATRASEPILHAPMVTVSAHVNAIGAITPERAEMAPDLVAVASMVVADDPDTARRLASRELGAVDHVVALADVLTGARSTSDPGREPNADLTVFKAMGLGVSDLVLGAEVLALAHAAGLGTALPSRERHAPRLHRQHQP